MSKSEWIDEFMMSEVERLTVDYKDGSHLAFSRNDQLQLQSAISEFVERGLNDRKIILLLVTTAEAEKYVAHLKESIAEIDKLIASSEIVISPIDDLLEQKEITVVTDMLTQKLQTFSELARSKERRGLNIIGRIVDNMAKQSRYEDALLMEMFWQNTTKSDPRITVVCMFDTIPYELERGLAELHNYPLQLGEAWEITPANFKCVKCGKRVEKEIRIHDPGLMEKQSKLVSIAMKQNDAGWIPFCFSCISNHPILKPRLAQLCSRGKLEISVQRMQLNKLSLEDALASPIFQKGE